MNTIKGESVKRKETSVAENINLTSHLSHISEENFLFRILINCVTVKPAVS